MNVTEEQLSRVERVDSTPERAPKFGLDRPYDGDFIFDGSKVRFMATTPGGIEELRLVIFSVSSRFIDSYHCFGFFYFFL